MKAIKVLVIHNERINAAAKRDVELVQSLIKLCPFNALEYTDMGMEINAGCKNCGLCAKQQPEYFEMKVEDAESGGGAKGNAVASAPIAVFAEAVDGAIHPVSFELLGKAKQLSEKLISLRAEDAQNAGTAQAISCPVYALLIGGGHEQAVELLRYGADKVFIYNHEGLRNFLIEPYTRIFEDFIKSEQPASVLIGATVIGRSLAPRIAARFGTGLTADCTVLDIKANTDLVQIRPAFGGNIMAQIITHRHRPQLATVRYKIFDMPKPTPIDPDANELQNRIVRCMLPEGAQKSRITITRITNKPKVKSITDADVIIAVGRGVKSEKDMGMIYRLAGLLKAEIACTRPLVESGRVEATRQIGLSGRAVKPKLIITVGISGSVQFKAGMQNAECIIAINNDENAPIFDICHYAIKGDLYEVLPRLIALLEGGSL